MKILNNKFIYKTKKSLILYYTSEVMNVRLLKHIIHNNRHDCDTRIDEYEIIYLFTSHLFMEDKANV